jgi:hypothetical protein
MNEGRPTKRTPELTATIAESISFGLTDEEAAAVAGITPWTMCHWRRIPEFSEALKKATALRLQNRLKKIEMGADGWQGAAWLTERLMPLRYSRPELQLNLIQQNNVAMNALSITISEKEVREIEDSAVTERENVKQMFARYRQGAVDYNAGHSQGEKPRIVDVETEQVASNEAEPISDEDETVQQSVKRKFSQYNPATAQPPLVHREGDEKKEVFWAQFTDGDGSRLVEKRTALLVTRTIVLESVGPRFAQGIVFESEPISVGSVLRKIEALSGSAGYQTLLKKTGYIPHSS